MLVAPAAAAAAAVTGVVVGKWPYALLAGWDAAGVVFTAWVWALLSTADPADAAAHARREDPVAPDRPPRAHRRRREPRFGRLRARRPRRGRRRFCWPAGVLGVVLSWLVVHTLYWLRYARQYYTGHPGGVDSNQADPPRYVDFAYLSFTIGMTFQLSDTDLEMPTIRATALRQALLAHLFGAVIVAATINLVSQLASKS